MADDFTRLAVSRSSVHAPKMLGLCHLANLPFDKVWIEYNMNVRLDAQNDQVHNQQLTGYYPRNGEDRGLGGFLFERIDPANPGLYHVSNVLYATFQDGSNRLDVDGMPISPASYLVDLSGMLPYLTKADGRLRKYGLPDPYRIMDGQRAQLVEDAMRATAWGYGTRDEDGSFLAAASEELLRRGAVCLEKRFYDIFNDECIAIGERAIKRSVDMFYDSMVQGRGDLRFIMAILALINVCPITYMPVTAEGSYRVKLRNVPYLDSHVITIHAGRKRIERLVDKAFEDARKHKRHEVRGHWALAEYSPRGARTPACVHEPVERDDDYALCGKCQRLIHWKDHFERGDAALGWVQHDYDVET